MFILLENKVSTEISDLKASMQKPDEITVFSSQNIVEQYAVGKEINTWLQKAGGNLDSDLYNTPGKYYETYSRQLPNARLEQ